MSYRRCLVSAVLLLIAPALSGCFTMVALEGARQEFRPGDYAWALREGRNNIIARFSGINDDGTPSKCTGQPAILIPNGPHTRPELLFSGLNSTYFGGNNNIYNQIERIDQGLGPSYYGDEQDEFSKYFRRSTCNADGTVKFTNVPSGDYFLQVKLDSKESAHKRVYIYGDTTHEFDLVKSCEKINNKRGRKFDRCGINPLPIDLGFW
jgi:hypothetical protein